MGPGFVWQHSITLCAGLVWWASYPTICSLCKHVWHWGSMHHEQSWQSTAQHGMISRLLACHGNASLLQPAAVVAMR